jgi:hypothetical protein
MYDVTQIRPRQERIATCKTCPRKPQQQQMTENLSSFVI